jgi:tRNA dimethylallyltransferase
MDIGTAKPTAEELSLAPHHLINICDPSEAYSAGQFCTDAKIEIEKILAKGKMPFLVGGTMMYFHALQKGIADMPKSDPEMRKKIQTEGEQKGWASMHEKLAKIDPLAAEHIHPNDTQRIGRALEVFMSTGEPLSERHKETYPLNDYEFVNIVLLPPDRALLHSKIEARFDAMLLQGFLDEVRALQQRGDLNADLPSIRTVGYRQAWAHLAGEYDYPAFRERAIAATRQLAKRQYTWLRQWQGAFFLQDPDGNLAYQYIISSSR